MLSYARITAPFAGIITRRNVDPGAFIPAATSSSSGQNAAIVTLTDLSRVRVQVAIPELESSLVATNQPTNITVEGLPGRAFAGNVSRFSYALEEQSKTMLAEIELPNPQFELRPGMYATVKIGLERKADALLVPVDALLFEKAGASVFTIANNKAKKVPVKTGFNDGANAQILTDLKPDQSVILLRKKTLVDGQPVQVETQ
jgi:RND family efflux transporter MFP subunit